MKKHRVGGWAPFVIKKYHTRENWVLEYPATLRGYGKIV